MAHRKSVNSNKRGKGMRTGLRSQQQHQLSEKVIEVETGWNTMESSGEEVNYEKLGARPRGQTQPELFELPVEKRDEDLKQEFRGLRQSILTAPHQAELVSESPRLGLPTPGRQRLDAAGTSTPQQDPQAVMRPAPAPGDQSSSVNVHLPAFLRKEPKMPSYQQGEDIENYLLRFERMAKTWQWPELEWACRLVPLLTGKALEAYTAMDEGLSNVYKGLKEALLMKFDISSETYRQRFRAASTPSGESPTETYHRLKGLYRRWVQPEEKTQDEIGEVIILEQLLQVLPHDIRTWVREHEPKDGLMAAKLALQYLNARKGGPPRPAAPAPRSLRDTRDIRDTRDGGGIPDEILTDQGTNFTSRLMVQLHRQLGIKGLRTTPYHPQTDGLVERFNQTLKNMLRKFVADTGKDWDKWLPFLLFAYREVPQASTGFSPFELLYGWPVQGPLDLLKKCWEGSPVATSGQGIVQYVLQMRDRLERYREEARANLQQAQKAQKRGYDQHARHRAFEPGQKVLLLLPSSTSKLLAQWQGPYLIGRKMGPVTYEVLHPDKGKEKQTYHVNLLKAWEEKGELSKVKSFLVRRVEEEDESDGVTEAWKGRAEVILAHLEEDKQDELKQLFGKYPALFSQRPGRTKVLEHVIRLKPGQNPVRQHPYRVPERLVVALKEEVHTMIEMDVVEPSSRYWQVPLDEQSKAYTAFRTPMGLFQFKVMPFGLHGAPATFQRLMDKVLQDCDDYCAAYLDDVVIYSHSWEEHIQHLSRVLGKIHDAGLTLNLLKCEWAKQETKYLGYQLGKGEVRPQVDKVESIRNSPQPRTKTQVKSFLGLAGWYRRFIPQFSTIAVPLTNLTSKVASNPVKWTEECEEAFRILKKRLCSFPVLQTPDFQKRFLVQVDASAVGIGAVLAQGEPGEELPVLYLSRKLLPRETRYSTIEKECLAIKWALDSLRYYLLGREFDLHTDHRALTWIQTMKDRNSRVTRWYLELQPFRFCVRHKAGKENVTPDYLSRLPNLVASGEEEGDVQYQQIFCKGSKQLVVKVYKPYTTYSSLIQLAVHCRRDKIIVTSTAKHHRQCTEAR
eukprot:XP_014001809.1 PREDICTED: uncharacterized protein LOC106572279 [Salmo salar]